MTLSSLLPVENVSQGVKKLVGAMYYGVNGCNVYHVIPSQEYVCVTEEADRLYVKKWVSAVITNKGLKSPR